MSTNRISLLPCNFIHSWHRHGFTTLLRSYMADPMGDHPRHCPQTEMQVIESLWHHPTVYIQLATIQSCVVGMAVCFENYSTFKAAPFLNIHDLVVLPEFRRLGVGSALIHGVILQALHTGCAKVTLEVRDDNSIARAIYARHGFQSCAPSMEYLSRDLATPLHVPLRAARQSNNQDIKKNMKSATPN